MNDTTLLQAALEHAGVGGVCVRHCSGQVLFASAAWREPVAATAQALAAATRRACGSRELQWVPGPSASRIVVTPLVAPAGDVAGVLCTVQIDRGDDPVALRRHLGYEHGLRIAAERAGRAQGALLGAISHALRSPLNALRGWTDLLARASPADQGLLDRAAAALARGVAQQTQLLDDIADAFLLVDGELELDFQSVDLAAVVQGGVELAQESAAVRGVSLACVVETPAPIAIVSGDSQRLAQVVRHLLANAIRFTPTGGAVTATVSLDAEGEHVLLDVRDTGAGIAAEDLPFVLARFGPDERPGSRSSGGVGLGLFLVRRLIALHHGSVAVASEGPGRGATFQVRIPRGR